MRFQIIFLVAVAVSTASSPVSAQMPIAQRNNAFALDFYRRWSAQRPGENIVLSPFSISAAIAMAYPGASGATAVQIRTALRFDPNVDKHCQAFRKLFDEVASESGPLVVANTLWMQDGFRVEANFRERMRTSFGGAFREVNFAAVPDSARTAINAVVEDQTRNKIPNLIPPGAINTLTRMVLANAIHFKDSWAVPFPVGETSADSFLVSGDRAVRADFMKLENALFNFFEDEVVTVLELPYHSGRFSMLVLLPKTDIGALERSLSGDAYMSWTFAPGRFRKIMLPKFRIEQEMQPTSVLKAMGITDAFVEGRADFSGIARNEKLFIGGVFHKAFIEVNEAGTEAAAATAVVVQTESAVVPVKELEFIANRPFLFVVRDRVTQAIVFVGRVSEP